METIAVITDIHANLPALEAALERIDELGIERVYCGGDLVGYGPHPNEVCDLIQACEIPTIYGNYDYAIARDEHDCGCAYITEHDRELGQQSVEWTLGQHRPAVQGLHARAARSTCASRSASREIHLVHGSPRKVNEYLFEDKPASLYERLAAAETADTLVFGHTHKPWVADFGGVRFVNCGSVGKPKDGDPRGAFAVLTASGPRPRRHDRARRVRRRGGCPRGRGRRAAPGVRQQAGAGGLAVDRSLPLWRRSAAEGLAAFALVFAGCGAIVADDRYDGAPRCGRRLAGVRPDHHGDDLRHRPPLRRAHQSGGHARLHAARGTSRRETRSRTSALSWRARRRGRSRCWRSGRTSRPTSARPCPRWPPGSAFVYEVVLTAFLMFVIISRGDRHPRSRRRGGDRHRRNRRPGLRCSAARSPAHR